MDQKIIDQRADSARFKRTSSSHHILPKLQPVPSIRSNTQEVLLVSPFSRSRSRVFYASEEIFNNTELMKPTMEMIQTKSGSGSGKFHRSGRRTSSSRKSHDSGFSDSVVGSNGSGRSISKTADKTENELSSPARKVYKWSSVTPIKRFLKPNEGHGNGHLSKLSDVLSCCGVSPSLFLCTSKPKLTDHIVGNPIDSTSNKNKSQVETPFFSQSSIRLTWPRRKRQQNTVDNNDVNKPSLNTNSKLYHSTKFGGRQSKKIPVELNQRAIRNFAVQDWFMNLRFSTEDECTSTLQSKAVARDFGDLMVVNARNCKDTILKIYNKYYRILSTLKTIQTKINDKHFDVLSDCLSKLLTVSQQFIADYKVDDDTRQQTQQQQNCLSDNINQLNIKLSSKTNINWEEETELKWVTELLKDLTKSLEDFSEALILVYVKEIIDILEEPPSLRAVKIATSVLSILGIQDDNLSRIVAVAGGVRVLLTVCIDPKYRFIRAKALRSLATLCCVAESICELEQSGGVECVSEILADDTSTEEEKCEAAGVIAQITSPSLDYNYSIEGLAENIPCLIQSLTVLAKDTCSGDSFLLSTAAIGNLSFFAKQTSVHLLKCETMKVLISVCLMKHPKCASVFAKDQVATVLVNMAGIPEASSDIIRNRGIELLLRFLHMVPRSSNSKTEIAALERVQQKSAISISRLCTEPSVAQRVVALGGVERLVQMCKDKEERNRSDAVLVACLAVVRKIASVCGYQHFKDLNALELVEPRLLDSFLIYSSKQESYV